MKQMNINETEAFLAELFPSLADAICARVGYSELAK